MNAILLQSATSGQDYSFVILLIGMFVVLYFFNIRPQSQKRKKQEKFSEALKKGDKVVTIGGLHGKVFSIEGNLVTLEVDKGVKLTFDRGSLSFEQSEAASNPTAQKK